MKLEFLNRISLVLISSDLNIFIVQKTSNPGQIRIHWILKMFQLLQFTVAGGNWGLKLIRFNPTIIRQFALQNYHFTIAITFSVFMKNFRPPKLYPMFVDFTIELKDAFIGKNIMVEERYIRSHIFEAISSELRAGFFLIFNSLVQCEACTETGEVCFIKLLGRPRRHFAVCNDVLKCL